MFIRSPIPTQIIISLTLLGLLLFGFHSSFALASPSFTRPVAAAVIQVGQSPAHAWLQVDGRVLIDRPGAHLEHPQLSPDGRSLAVAVIPVGNETVQFARLYLFDRASGQQLATMSGHTPQWTTDDAITFREGAELVTYSLVTRQRTRTFAPDPRMVEPESVQAANQRPLVDLAYPLTIRVLHHPNNGCRNVPAWRVDVIPFEEYVARVVPAEAPASWRFAALAAQAVAARTYAWRQILAGRPDYDVTDWANFQMMCDDRYPGSDAAVSATTGHYLSAMGDPAALPILAMYSAENGHPTLTNPNAPYLQAVPDLFALGKERFGHGYGLSQWGAQRRALAGHDYRQILGHYYTAVHLQNGINPSEPLGGFIEPAPGAALTTNAFRWRALTPFAASGIFVTITHNAGLFEPVTLVGAEGSWRAPLPLADNSVFTADLWIGGVHQDQVELGIDTSPPAPPSLQAPFTVTGATLPLTVTAAADSRLSFGQNWVWQGEALFHTSNSGRTVDDAAALNGLAWEALADVHQRGVWYGPYTTTLAAGRSYRALFALRFDLPMTGTTVYSATPLARLDVTDRGGEVILGLRDVWVSNFRATNRYQLIPVDFHLFEPAQGIEFRVAWPGQVDLALDRVQVLSLPGTDWQADQPFLWQLYGGTGLQTIYAAAFDAADNLSQLVSMTVQVSDDEPPLLGDVHAPTGWISTTTVAVSTSVTDSLSGLDLQSGVLDVNGSSELSATFAFPENPWAGQQLAAVIEQVTDGAYTAHFRVADQAGNGAQSEAVGLNIDTTPPTVQVTTSLALTGEWFLAPVEVALAAADNLSGVREVGYALGDEASLVYTRPIRLDTPGVHSLFYWAVDEGGNVGEREVITASLDLAPPTVNLAQLPADPGHMKLQWQAYDDAAGVAQVTLESQQPSGVWQPHPQSPLSQTTGLMLFPVVDDASLLVRMRAEDSAGRVGEWAELQLAPSSNWVFLPVVSKE